MRPHQRSQPHIYAIPANSYASSSSRHYTSANATHAPTSSRQEPVQKVTESTASSSGPHRDSSTNVDIQSGYPYSAG
ncbi:hypothetical protein BGX23_000348, partial [Mortierella sp. AD031]